MKKIILGSTSPRRKEILEILGIPFSIVPSEYEEDMTLQKSMTPIELVLYLSRGKGESLVSKLKDNAIVICADTFIVFKGECLGKPLTREKNIEMLEKFSGNKLEIVTGLYMHDTYSGQVVCDYVKSDVLMKKLSYQKIVSYVDTGEGLDKAGGFAIQLRGNLLVDYIVGDRYNIMGLPLGKVYDLLNTFGIQ